MPFGVQLPEDLGKQTPVSEGAPDGASPSGSQDLSPEGSSPSGEVSTESVKSEITKELLDLDKLERFRFDGKEWNRNDFKNSYLMHQDYTRKTQELAENRKYVDNFQVDLQTVVNDPSRMKEFRAVYPKSFVQVAEKVLAHMQPKQSMPQATPNAPQDELSRKFEERFATIDQKLSKIDQWEQQQLQNEIKSIESWLDNQFSTLSKKYNLADPEVVTARAQVLSDNGQKVDEKVLEKLFEKHHSEVKERWDKTYKEKVTKQKEAGTKSRDMGAGGGTPGGQPKQVKTIKEATKLALEDLGAR